MFGCSLIDARGFITVDPAAPIPPANRDPASVAVLVNAQNGHMGGVGGSVGGGQGLNGHSTGNGGESMAGKLYPPRPYPTVRRDAYLYIYKGLLSDLGLRYVSNTVLICLNFCPVCHLF